MSRNHHFATVILVTVTMSWAAAPLPALAAEPAQVSLVDKDLSTWRDNDGNWTIVGQAKMDPADQKKIATTPGSGVLANGPAGKTKNIFSKLQHADVEAHLEFMVPKGSNSGVYFQGRYEVQILDSWGVEKPKHGDCGGIYQRWAAGRGFEGRPPKLNAARKPGEWQTFDVVFLAPRFDAAGKKTANAKFVSVLLNGKPVQENIQVTGPTRSAAFNDEKPLGPIMLQGDHGPVAYRNIQIKPLAKQQ